ncbi:MAG: substrate-binding domain-containing protein [Oscillospiraceae bacterium]|jgi:ABC-type sugar transport system substrate-binding protein|nr:substrate-binding domain-containing protein [Oscillospiraceae bacterium]
MKKTIAILLALLMTVSIFACDPSKDQASDTPVVSPAETPDAVSPDVPDEPDTSDEPVSGAVTDVSASENDIGFFSDGVDPQSRETYDIVWAYMRPMALFQNINDALVELEPVLNFKTSSYCANSDIDAMIQNIQIYADQEVDGFLILIDPTASTRIKEVLDDTGVPYVAMMNSVRDESGSEIVPCVGIDGEIAGAETVQWLFDNYKTYWGDIDVSEIGLLDFNFSPNTDFDDRHNGSLARFQELNPNGKVFDADGVSGALDEQTGYDLASATLAANPDVKYWFIAGCIELYSQGAARAVEALNMDDRVLITAVGSDVLPAEWDNDYDGSWVSCLALSNYQYTIPGICALTALMDGKATHDTLWSSKRAPNDKVTFYNVSYGLLTKDNYQDFFAKVKQDAGL